MCVYMCMYIYLKILSVVLLEAHNSKAISKVRDHLVLAKPLYHTLFSIGNYLLL